jgi:hypothetical protein
LFLVSANLVSNFVRNTLAGSPGDAVQASVNITDKNFNILTHIYLYDSGFHSYKIPYNSILHAVCSSEMLALIPICMVYERKDP